MLATPAKLPPGGKQQGPITVPQSRDSMLMKSVRAALDGYLRGRKLVRVQIRHAEGSKTEGFLKIEGGKAERLLVDFKATSTSDGALSSLEVGGKKISLANGPATKRTR